QPGVKPRQVTYQRSARLRRGRRALRLSDHFSGSRPGDPERPLQLAFMAGRPLHEIVEAGWAEALAPVADKIAACGDFLRAEVAAGRKYLPAGPNVLRAFQQPFDAVKVLIMGQDPYPTPGHAVGLSFSVAPDVRPLPGSLVNIF